MTKIKDYIIRYAKELEQHDINGDFLYGLGNSLRGIGQFILFSCLGIGLAAGIIALSSNIDDIYRFKKMDDFWEHFQADFTNESHIEMLKKLRTIKEQQLLENLGSGNRNTEIFNVYSHISDTFHVDYFRPKAFAEWFEKLVENSIDDPELLTVKKENEVEKRRTFNLILEKIGPEVFYKYIDNLLYFKKNERYEYEWTPEFFEKTYIDSSDYYFLVNLHNVIEAADIFD